MPSTAFRLAINAMDELSKESSIDIGGKRYTMVKDRVALFRKYFGDDYGIATEIAHVGASSIIVRAVITNGLGHTISSGMGYVKYGQDDFSTFAPVEVAETSAIGRALACFGLSGDEYASANEVEKSIATKNNNATNELVEAFDPSWYVPAVGYNEDLSVVLGMIDAQISQLTDQDSRGRYWSAIKQFREWLHANEPEMYDTLKEVARNSGKAR